MKTYNITVNGVSYLVNVEEVTEGNVNTPIQPTPTQASKAAPIQAPNVSAGSIAVKAPMPGNIMKVNVKVGDAVKKGDCLVVLEAMKMENDICAPTDGIVASVNASQGATVETDTVLVMLN